MKSKKLLLRYIGFIPLSLLFSSISVAVGAGDEFRQVGDVVVMTAGERANVSGGIDYANAKPMPLTRAKKTDTSYSKRETGMPGFSSGNSGDGRLFEEVIPAPLTSGSALDSLDKVEPAEYGTKKQPFSTARADLYGLRVSVAYPYRASGKLFFNAPEGPFVCSASLIEPGVVVTAAHCVSEYGKNIFYSDFRYIPSYYFDGQAAVAPYGVWSWSKVWVMADYLKGKKCSGGVVCESDVAVILLEPKRDPMYARYSTGWLGYGWNKYGFSGTKTQITQIGYPVCLDDGQLMERNDSQGVMRLPIKIIL